MREKLGNTELMLRIKILEEDNRFLSREFATAVRRYHELVDENHKLRDRVTQLEGALKDVNN